MSDEMIQQQQEGEGQQQQLQSLDYQQLSKAIHERQLTQIQKEEYVKALYDQHGTVRLAAQQIDVSPSTIVRYVNAWKKRRGLG